MKGFIEVKMMGKKELFNIKYIEKVVDYPPFSCSVYYHKDEVYLKNITYEEIKQLIINSQK